MVLALYTMDHLCFERVLDTVQAGIRETAQCVPILMYHTALATARQGKYVIGLAGGFEVRRSDAL